MSPVVHNPASDARMIFDYEGVRRVISDHIVFSYRMSVAGRRNPLSRCWRKVVVKLKR